MRQTPIIVRDATERDIPAIFDIRTSVRENHLSLEQMAAFGITPRTILDALETSPCLWVAVSGDKVVGFSMANAEQACLFAAFVRPEWEGHGVGRLLVARAEAFLFATNRSIWLTTDSASRAAGFYENLGWRRMSAEAGEVRFEKQQQAV